MRTHQASASPRTNEPHNKSYQRVKNDIIPFGGRHTYSDSLISVHETTEATSWAPHKALLRKMESETKSKAENHPHQSIDD